MEIIKENLTSDKIEIHQQVKKKQEYKYLKSQRLIPGLKVFEFDYEKLSLKAAEVIQTNSIRYETLKPDENKKIMISQTAIYFQAHCKRTAIKKANKWIYEVEGVENYFSLDNKKNIISKYQQ